MLIVALAAGLLTQFFPCCAFAIRSFSKVSATPGYVTDVFSRVTLLTFSAELWRQRSEYPKAYDHFRVYVTHSDLAMTGQQALTEGCGTNGRPYRYRGKGHITELRKALQGVEGKVWVGAVDTTTPWTWTSESDRIGCLFVA